MSELASGQSPPPVGGRRGFLLAIVLLAAGAGLMFRGYGRGWSSSVIAEPGLPTLRVDLAGGDLIAEGVISAVVALAGIAALVAMRRVGRMFTGIVMMVVGVTTIVHAAVFGIGARTSSGLDAVVSGLVSERAGIDINASEASSATTTTASAWWILVLVGGLMIVVGGAVALARSSSWPTMGGRYESGGASRSRRRSAPESDWDLLDRGLDPTIDPTTGQQTAS